MELFLIRHADAEPADLGMTDAERPLSEGGLKKMRKGAKGLRNILSGTFPPLDAILTSPLHRAIQTARIIAGEVNDSDEVIECTPLGGEFSWADLLPFLNRYPPQSRVALVGHEPELGKLAVWLLSGGPKNASIHMKKGSVFCCEIEELTEEPKVQLLWFLTPKQLRLLK